MVKRCVNNDCDLVVSQINVFLELIEFCQHSLDVMKSNTWRSHYSSNELLLLIEITLSLFPYLNFIENDSYVISWSTDSLLAINDPFQIINSLRSFQLISLVDKTCQVQNLSLSTVQGCWSSFERLWRTLSF
jgi:hypothetical protein